MPQGFEALVIQNFDHLTDEIKTIRMGQELMQLDLNAIKLEQARQKQRQEELSGPLKGWAVDDSVALFSLVKRERRKEEGEKQSVERQDKTTKRIQGWRDRLLLATAVFAIFANLRDQLDHGLQTFMKLFH